jgi:multidrug efflux pump subunit AcrA (membrane-fusion protein)
MYARISVITDSRLYAVTLPEQAVIEDFEKGIFSVFTIKGAKAIKKEVKPGLRAKGRVGIESGLQKNDSIVIKGQEYLQDGQEIKVVVQ